MRLCDNLSHSKNVTTTVESQPSKISKNNLMNKKNFCSQLLVAGTLCSLSVSSAHAHSYGVGNADAYSGGGAMNHAPIGVMGDHMHKKGEYMFSYRFSHMHMQGNRIGNNKVSPGQIATTNPNPFFGLPGQPPTTRVVPTRMTMQMHMFGGMYAPTDWLTLMAMASYVEKDMDHVTFMGGAGIGATRKFNTKSSGFGDTKIGAMFKLFETNVYNTNHHAHINFNISIPTGSLSERSVVSAPNGMMPNLRLPYPMQLGSGTFDALPGITYTGNYRKLGWGGQYMAEIRMERNQAGYAHGDKHMLTAWSSYEWVRWFSTSARIIYNTQESIRGIDPAIVAPVQTADPGNQGGRQLSVAVGFNLEGQRGILKGHRLAAEAIVPLYRRLHGPQLETDWRVVAGWQYANRFLQ
jgi:hypothetical protein